MISVLEFDMDINYRYAWNIAARTIYYLNDNLEDCMILYKYNLADGFIWTKFGTSDPDKLVFEKLIGRSLIIFHSDVFREKTERFEALLYFCQDRGIDVYIPLCRSIKTHTVRMREILNQFEHNFYEFTEMNPNWKADKENEIKKLIRERMKPLFRDIKLRNLFD